MTQSEYSWRSAAGSFICLFLLHFVVTDAVHAGATDWIDIRVVDGHMLVDSEIAGIEGYSIIDTGAQVNAINGQFLEAEGLSFKTGRNIRVSGVFSESRRPTYREIPATVFGAPINFKGLVDLDLGSANIQLLLGASFLERYIFQFDYPNERMRLITRDSVDLEAIKNVKSRKSRNGGSPRVRVGLDDETEAWLLMDTGSAGGILIERTLAKRLDWVGAFPTIEDTSGGVISTGRMERFRVPGVQFGPFKIADALVSIPASGESLEYFETRTPLGTRIAEKGETRGILGYDILKHFMVTIDYASGSVHIYPSEKITEESDAQDAEE